MYNSPLVSVIIPCYNVAPYILRCLDSVYTQTYANLEVIVVDNNSTDGTLEIVQEYLSKNQYKALVIEEPNQGAPFARNTGLSYTQGKWIQFLDADDALLPEKIAHQVQLLTCTPDPVDVVSGATIEIDILGNKTAIYPAENLIFGLLRGHRSAGSTCSNLWSKEKLMEVEGFDVQLSSSQEIDLLSRLFIANAKFLQDNKPLTKIYERQDAVRITSQSLYKRVSNWLLVRSKLLSYLHQNAMIKFSQEESIWLLQRVLYYLELQSVKDLDQSHHMFHHVFWPVLKDQRRNASLMSRAKCIAYEILGFKRARFFINKIKNHS